MAKRFENGVRWYTKGKVEIGFPEDYICCRLCPLFATAYGTRRDYCAKTGESIVEPDRLIGGMCPIDFEEGKMLNRVKLDLQKAQLRIAELETLLCPDGHEWMPDVKQDHYRCYRCGKVHVGELPKKEENNG